MVAIDDWEFGWEGVYECGGRGVIIISSDEQSVQVNVGGEYATVDVGLIKRKVVDGVKILDGEIRYTDADGDEITLFPTFSNTGNSAAISYTVNDTKRADFREISLSGNQMTLTVGFISRVIILPKVYQPLLVPLRRMLELSGVKHDLGPEPPLYVNGWTLSEISSDRSNSALGSASSGSNGSNSGMNGSGTGLFCWRNESTKTVSFTGPSQEEIDDAHRNGVVYGSEVLTNRKIVLLENLRVRNLKEVPVAADGCCQFRSVAYHVFGESGQHEKVRKEVCQHLRENSDHYAGFCEEPSFENYCYDMENTRKWGDSMTLQAAADCYGLVFKIITSNAGQDCLKLRPHNSRDAPEVWLAYLEESGADHYNPVIVQPPTGVQYVT